jgi:hypothetical protein
LSSAPAHKSSSILGQRTHAALIERAVELADQPWDAAIRPPGTDVKFREAVFGSRHGLLGFYLDEDARLIRIFDIVWLGY